ncbi:MAG: hypothetical protein M3Q12_10550 [Pseudomonadota bacterium]|uniref:hypothetical protein n=1 Tax=Polaromonas sp. TaxID=1869339 RepID=UPI0017A206A6|nr:hypothetical protein [Polaromonas sp.]MBA3594062.1 hypothetical protein [Polaromonas sp.]MDQ3272587.1 hypothetical protein [Pseudomonadota bacterium]
MNFQNALKIIAVCAISTGATAVFAHEGHAIAGTHWHATDVWGYVAAACVLALAIWLSRGDK